MKDPINQHLYNNYRCRYSSCKGIHWPVFVGLNREQQKIARKCPICGRTGSKIKSKEEVPNEKENKQNQ